MMTGDDDKWEKGSASNPLVGDLARSVVENLVVSPGRARLDRLGDASNLVYTAALGKAWVTNPELQSQLAALKITDPDSVENCITSALHKLGEEWLADIRSFAEVASAAARLYDFCKHFDAGPECLQPVEHGLSVLLTTVDFEMHLVGPTILAQKLRRAGHSVSVMCNANGHDLSARLLSNTYDGLMISTASHVGLDHVAKTIKHIRNNTRVTPPIAVGGAVLEYLEAGEAERIGADLVTNDRDRVMVLFSEARSCLHLGAAQ